MHCEGSQCVEWRFSFRRIAASHYTFIHLFALVSVNISWHRIRDGTYFASVFSSVLSPFPNPDDRSWAVQMHGQTFLAFLYLSLATCSHTLWGMQEKAGFFISALQVLLHPSMHLLPLCQLAFLATLCIIRSALCVNVRVTIP